ncbi:MAG: ATP-binding protein [Candidatus Xenobiia bacterium LiM19]
MNAAKKIKVLHIDDDPTFIEIFKTMFGSDFDIISRDSAVDLSAALEEGEIDALVLDYEMPGRNGLDVLLEVRGHHPSLPVIFYTGQGNEEVARQAFTEGATDYFVKHAAVIAQREKMVNSLRKAVEKRAVEADLEEKQAMLEGIIDNNPYSIMITDSEGRPIRINKAHTKMMGMSPGPDGKVLFDDSFSIPDEVKDAIQKEWEKKRGTYSLFNDENALKDEEIKKLAPLWQMGEVVKFPPYWYALPFPVEGSTIKPVCWGSTGFSVKNSRGGIVNYVQMHEDITARVEAEEALRKAHEELTHAHDELRKAYEREERKVIERTAELALANSQLAETNGKLAEANTRLQAEIDEGERLRAEVEAKNTELQHFAHTVSHDVRNSILVMRCLMDKSALMPEERESTQQSLRDSMVHLQSYVERLLFLAEAGKAIARTEMTALDSVAEKAFSLAAASRGDAGIHVAASFPKILCDPDAFHQVFSNLFTNALAHAAPGTAPVIHVDYAVKDGTIDIAVRDNGNGIEPAVLPKIFEVSFTTNRQERFGLGLAIVKKLVEAHGGLIRAESEGPGQGTAFIITLPHREEM